MSTAHLPASQRALIASHASLTRWAGVTSPEARRAATAPAAAGRRRKWELQADPAGILPPAELDAAVERLKKAHYRLMALRSAQARAARTSRRPETERATAVLPAVAQNPHRTARKGQGQ